MFNMSYFDTEFSSSGMNDMNPFNNMVMVEGLIVPLDSVPEEYQQMVRKAPVEGEDIDFHMEK
jgi:hypothetical protein